MKTFAEELEKRQPELNRITAQEELEHVMLKGDMEMRRDEVLALANEEQRAWFWKGWEMAWGVDRQLGEITQKSISLGRTIYDEISRKLGINEPLT